MRLSNLFTPKTLEDVATREIELTEKRRTVQAAVNAAETLAGESYLAGEDGGAEVEEITRLVVQRTAIERAIAILRALRFETIVAKYRRDAADLRKQLDERQAELAAHTARLDALVSEINALEDTKCVIAADVEWGQKPRRSHQLQDQITSLEQRASDLKQRQIPAAGFIDLADLAGDADAVVIRAVLTHESDGPDAATVSAWLRSVQEAAGPGRPFGDRPRRVRLSWRAGVIDTAESFIFLASYSPERIGALGTSNGFATELGTFKAAAAVAAA